MNTLVGKYVTMFVSISNNIFPAEKTNAQQGKKIGREKIQIRKHFLHSSTWAKRKIWAV